jgi:hypothetical protein
MRLDDLLRKTAMIAAGALFLAGNTYGQGAVTRMIQGKTSNGKDTVMMVNYTRAGNQIMRHNPDGSLSMENKNSSIVGPGVQGYRSGSLITMNGSQSEKILSSPQETAYKKMQQQQAEADFIRNKNANQSDLSSLVSDPELANLNEQKAQEEFELGKGCYGRRDYQCAREHFEKAVGLDKNNAEYIFNLGMSLDRVKEDRRSEGAAAISKAIKIAESRKDFDKKKLAGYYANLARGPPYKPAIELVKKAMELDPDNLLYPKWLKNATSNYERFGE